MKLLCRGKPGWCTARKNPCSAGISRGMEQFISVFSRILYAIREQEMYIRVRYRSVGFGKIFLMPM